MKNKLFRFLMVMMIGVTILQPISARAEFPYDGQSSSIAEAASAVTLMNDGVRLYDKAKINEARAQLVSLFRQNSNSDELKFLIAKSYEQEANIIRCYDREQQGLSHSQTENLRSEEKRLAEEGLPYIQSLSSKYQENANVLTVESILFTHKINGMASGMKNGPKAKRLLEKALRLEPNNARVLAAYGRMFVFNPSFAGGNLEKAEETYKKVIELDPKLTSGYIMLARTYFKKNKLKETGIYLHKALEMNPDNKEAQLLLEKYGVGKS
ncbi:MAG: hypothetical protein HZC17_05340 [Candidatus Omnitrophica bacterium]|nr:hypothetical protein [Candidatus Omnitrophota bacterium]